MRPAEPLPIEAIIWAERQAGVLSRAQLISFGLCNSQMSRLVRQQVLRRLDRGIYILGMLEPTWHYDGQSASPSRIKRRLHVKIRCLYASDEGSESSGLPTREQLGSRPRRAEEEGGDTLLRPRATTK
jgi:hypothetical protein